MIIDEKNFKIFVDAIDVDQDLIAVTEAKTEDAVFAKMDENNFKPLSK